MIIRKNIKNDENNNINIKKYYIDYKLYKKVKETLLKFTDIDINENLNISYIIKTKSRSSTVYPCFVNLTIYVYNGKRYIPIKIYKDYIGHKLGEFVITRNFTGHKKKSRPTNIKRKVKTNSLYRKYFENLIYNNYCLEKKQFLVHHRINI